MLCHLCGIEQTTGIQSSNLDKFCIRSEGWMDGHNSTC